MIYLVIVALLGAVLFVVTQQRKKKHSAVEKDALTLAWEKQDFDSYLALLDEKIRTSKNKKEKNILATLKMPVYLIKKDAASMDSLKRNVKAGELTKQIRVTFLCQYIMGLFITGRSQRAFQWIEAEQAILTEARNNGTYSLYIGLVDALDAFYRNKTDAALSKFEELEQRNLKDPVYAPIIEEHLKALRNNCQHKLQ